jgi:hypothetical protein
MQVCPDTGSRRAQEIAVIAFCLPSTQIVRELVWFVNELLRQETLPLMLRLRHGSEKQLELCTMRIVLARWVNSVIVLHSRRLSHSQQSTHPRTDNLQFIDCSQITKFV